VERKENRRSNAGKAKRGNNAGLYDLIPYTFPHSHKTFHSLQFCFSVALKVLNETMSNFLSNNTNQNPNPNKSIEVNQPPTDSVSSLNFSPKSNLLVATSWDNQVLHFFFFNAMQLRILNFLLLFLFLHSLFFVGSLLGGCSWWSK